MTDTAPIPVSIATPVPIPVAVVSGLPPAQPHIQDQARDPSLPARTTFQEDVTTAGQRQINLIWERTQALIAVTVVIVTMIGGIYSMVSERPLPTIVAMAFGTVVGFYFSRTNHSAIGGTGAKAPMAPYTGR